MSREREEYDDWQCDEWLKSQRDCPHCESYPCFNRCREGAAPTVTELVGKK